MTMILQLLVAAVAVGLGVNAGVAPPPYKQYVKAMDVAAGTLEKNVLSMEGNIPLLNDSRRHYAEIVHVVNYIAIAESGCARFDYYKIYQKCLNISAPQAISNPEEVVDEIRKYLVDVDKNTYELQELINNCVLTVEECNKMIDYIVKHASEERRHQADILLAAGVVATDLNELNEKFEEVSKNLKAHQYVITSPEYLQQIVWDLVDLHQELYGICTS